MSNDEAKFLLKAYRPGGHDAADPAMAAALEQAKRDPALAAWLQHEQAHDAAVAAKLREIVPPAGLREAILAGARASGPAPAPRARWRQPVWVGVAAAVAVMLGLAVWWRLAPAGGASLEELAVNFVDHGFRLQKHSADVGALKAWLAEKKGPLPEALPAEFAHLRALGCRTLDFRGRDVSLVCFERGGKEFHVFVARRGDWPGMSGSATPRFLERNKLVAAAWSDTKHHYVVVSDADLAALKRVM
jgi:hypothetical protein